METPESRDNLSRRERAILRAIRDSGVDLSDLAKRSGVRLRSINELLRSGGAQEGEIQRLEDALKIGHRVEHELIHGAEPLHASLKLPDELRDQIISLVYLPDPPTAVCAAIRDMMLSLDVTKERFAEILELSEATIVAACNAANGIAISPPPPPDKFLAHLSGLVRTAIRGRERHGQATAARRRSSDVETCLGAEDEARAIAKLIASASTEDDFSFAVYGSWGRGKTFLMDKVAHILKANNGYACVRFNAWKYRSTPEVWAHLYQAFLESLASPDAVVDTDRCCLHRSLKRYASLGLGLRASILRFGFWPLTMSAVLVLLALLPMSTWSSVLVMLVGTFGIGWALFVSQVALKGHNAAVSLLARYGRLADHRAKLGAQSLIGEDLKGLLIASLPKSTFPKNRYIWLGLLALIATAFSGIWVLSYSAGELPAALMQFAPMKSLIAAIYQFTSSASRGYFVVSLWSAGLVALTAIAIEAPTSPNHVLLIVDDLDRCEAAQMLEIIESIRLLLEAKEIHGRVQVAMLIEEGRLKASIEQKFQISRAPAPSPALVAEHLDKIFICHIRLWKLGVLEIAGVAEKFIGHELEMAHARLTQYLRASRPESVDDLQKALKAIEDGMAETEYTASENFTGTIARQDQLRRNEAILDDHELDAEGEEYLVHLPFLRDERRAITNSLCRLHGRLLGRSSDIENIRNDREIGPRFVRSFILKYQLARLLLDEAGVRWTADLVASQLEDAVFNSGQGKVNDTSEGDIRIHRVIQMVA